MGGRIHYTEQRDKEEASRSRLLVSAAATSSPVPGLPSWAGAGSAGSGGDARTFAEGFQGPCLAATLLRGFLGGDVFCAGSWRSRYHLQLPWYGFTLSMLC